MTPIDNNLASATYSAPPRLRTPDASHFSDLIAPRDTATDRHDKTTIDSAREAARELVSIALIQPILTQARDDPFASDLFHGGRTEEAFGAQLDEIYSERITAAGGFPLIDAVYNRIAPAHSRLNTHG